MSKPYFRPGAGSIIYNEAGEILVFERADYPGTWQFQQGGMDHFEEPVSTLWRELHEETGLQSHDVTLTHEFPHWTLYSYPESIRTQFADECLGQVHRWFFLRLNPTRTVDLSQAPDKEFINWRWSTFSRLLAETNEMKLNVYQALAEYFEQEVLPRR